MEAVRYVIESESVQVLLPNIKNGREPPPPPFPGSIEEMIATAKIVGYAPGVPDGPLETALDIERLTHARLGWER